MKRNVILYYLKATKECLEVTEKRVGIAVEAGRVLREESEEVAHVRALLHVNMIGHLRLSAVRNQNHQQRRKEYLIKTTRKRRGE